MSKDLEEGEIEDGELPDETSEITAGTDAPSQALEADPTRAESEPAKPAPVQDPESAAASAEGSLAASVAPPDLSLLGLPSYDAPIHSYGSSMVFSAYGTAPYSASAPAQLLERRQSSFRDQDYASTSYDSPRFARRISGASFVPRRSDPRGYSPSYSQQRYADQDDDTSSFESKPGNSMAADDDSYDEGELPSVHRSLNSHARHRRPARDVASIISSIKSLSSTADVPAAKKSLERVSLDLMDALEDLEELQEALSGSTAIKADDNSQLADMAGKFLKGLTAIYLVCNIGNGKMSNLSAAGKLVRAVIAHQDALLTAAHRKELEGWTKSSKVFKALADNEEESVQPKKPKAEPQPRTPYVPKQPQPRGQKRQGKGTQQGPRGKKQKKDSLADNAADTDTEAPPLPPPDSPSPYDSSQTIAEAELEDDESLPAPPLPPPSPNHAAVAYGHSSGQLPSASVPQLHSPVPSLDNTQPRSMTLPPPDAPTAPHGRAQVGFKLPMNKRQKLKMTAAEEPADQEMRLRLQRHLALQQQQQQQQMSQQLQLQLQQHQRVAQPQGSMPQQAALPAASAGHLPELSSRHQLPNGTPDPQSHLRATPQEYANGLAPDAQHKNQAQQHSRLSEQQHWQQRLSRQGPIDDSALSVPGLQPDMHQSPQQLPVQLQQQLPQAELALPPGLVQEPDESAHQAPQQLQRRLSHRHVHHRRSRHSHRTDRANPGSPTGHAEPALLPDNVNPHSQAIPQQTGYGSRPLPDQPMMHPDAQHVSGGVPYHGQDRQPASMLPGPLDDQHQAGMQNGGGAGFGGLAESGGPVAVASGQTAKTGVQVLADDVKSLLRQRKLCLVLDLDHTLINSARFSEVDPEHEAMLRSHQANEALRLPEERRELFRLDRIQMWTKLRPAVRQFLESAHEHFELWIHTNGNRSYAAAIVELLDPSGRLFGQRIIAQGAAGDGIQQDLTKRLMQGLEGREPIALVVDDTSSVWGNHEENLVAVERYIYFPASRRQFGSKSKALLELRRDETPQSGMLMTALNVLLRTHRRTFAVLRECGGVEAAGYSTAAQPPWDVRQVLQDERKQVLAGVHIMFSRVIPLQDGRPELHPMWRKAVKFGATCTTQPSDAVTHVAAYVNGTEKVYWAQRTGKYVVTPEWLNCSAMLWKRAAEDAFPVIAIA